MTPWLLFYFTFSLPAFSLVFPTLFSSTQSGQTSFFINQWYSQHTEGNPKSLDHCAWQLVQENRDHTVNWGQSAASPSHRWSSRNNSTNYDNWVFLKARTWRDCPGVSTLSHWERQRPGENILDSFHMTKDDKIQYQVYSLISLLWTWTSCKCHIMFSLL